MLECIYFFIIGAFTGWLLECVFKFITKNFIRTPGILNTPFCILYGLGTVLLSVAINKISENIWVLFIISMLILTIMEYITFILLKKIYKVQLWDYSDMTFSINEKVCLEFSIVWGVLGALYIKYLLPILINFYTIAKSDALAFSLVLLMVIILIDFIISSYYIIKKRYKAKIKQQV